MTRPFRLMDRLKSFTHAFRGIGLVIRTQHNAWIHALAAVIVIAMGLCLRLSRSEWIWICGAMMSVWIAEALNTAVEFLADATNPDFHPLIGKAKDVAAGAVLIASIGAVAIGLMTFGPHLLALAD